MGDVMCRRRQIAVCRLVQWQHPGASLAGEARAGIEARYVRLRTDACTTPDQAERERTRLTEKGASMNANWIHSSTKLPREGQQIEFMLDHRNAPLQGTYSQQSFHSRWAEYDVERVGSWCDLALACDRPAAVRVEAACVLSSMPSQRPGYFPSSAGGIAHAA
jgi:hypothetical protein